MQEQEKQDILEGFLLVKKPNGITSYQAIARLKRAIGKRMKIGHAGTLDMFASGLLIIGIGRKATRELEKFMKLDKRYIATGKLGQLTDTLDYTGERIHDEESPVITREQLQEVIASFGASYEQIPPIFSALKFEGYSLSDLARRKKKTEQELREIVAHKKRDITIYELKLTDFSPPYFSIEAYVSHGTYIRSLVNDIAQKVGTYATTHELARTQIGPFILSEAISTDDLDTVADIERNLIAIDVMLERIKTA